MSTDSETKSKVLVTKVPSARQGGLGLMDDRDIAKFYGNSVTESYRLKSELIASHLADIGMGK